MLLRKIILASLTFCVVAAQSPLYASRIGKLEELQDLLHSPIGGNVARHLTLKELIKLTEVNKDFKETYNGPLFLEIIAEKAPGFERTIKSLRAQGLLEPFDLKTIFKNYIIQPRVEIGGLYSYYKGPNAEKIREVFDDQSNFLIKDCEGRDLNYKDFTYESKIISANGDFICGDMFHKERKNKSIAFVLRLENKELTMLESFDEASGDFFTKTCALAISPNGKFITGFGYRKGARQVDDRFPVVWEEQEGKRKIKKLKDNIGEIYGTGKVNGVSNTGIIIGSFRIPVEGNILRFEGIIWKGKTIGFLNSNFDMCPTKISGDGNTILAGDRDRSFIGLDRARACNTEFIYSAYIKLEKNASSYFQSESDQDSNEYRRFRLATVLGEPLRVHVTEMSSDGTMILAQSSDKDSLLTRIYLPPYAALAEQGIKLLKEGQETIEFKEVERL